MRTRHAGGLTASIAVAVAVAACGGSSQPTARSLGLIKASYAGCGRQGRALATYLITGKPTSNDPAYGDLRMQALKLNNQRQSLYIRQAADAEIQQCDQTEQQAAQQQQTASRAEQITATCQQADGSMNNNINGSVCVIDGIEDQVNSSGGPDAALQFPPANVTRMKSQCSGIGGRFVLDQGGGYVLDNAGWDCVFGNTSSVWTEGFQDAVVSFNTDRWVVPISEAAAMNTLDSQCMKAGGEFGLDTGKAANVFSCLLDGTTEDDVTMNATPAYAKPL